MTDPRIEAAARALCERQGYPSDGSELAASCGFSENWEAFSDDAQAALEAADAAAWRPMSEAPKDGTVINVVLPEDISKSDQDFYCYPGSRVSFGWAWENRKFRPCTGLNLPVFIEPTHWQPLPAPPNATLQHTPETITIPELRNDRPIPGKEG